jgi:hypothetical protein
MIQEKLNQIGGLRECLLTLRFCGNKIAADVEEGIKLAGWRLRQESARLVPVETGALKASVYARVEGTGFATKMSVGFTAPYAMAVHEAVGMVLKGQPRPSGIGRYWDPQPPAQAKFLEEPSRRLAPELLKIIKERALLNWNPPDFK